MTQFLIKFAYAAVILGLIFLGFKYVLPLLMPFLLAFVFSVLLRSPAEFLSKKLSNEGFLAKAPAQLIDAEKAKLAKAQEKMDKILASIKALG